MPPHPSTAAVPPQLARRLKKLPQKGPARYVAGFAAAILIAGVLHYVLGYESQNPLPPAVSQHICAWQHIAPFNDTANPTLPSLECVENRTAHTLHQWIEPALDMIHANRNFLDHSAPIVPDLESLQDRYVETAAHIKIMHMASVQLLHDHSMALQVAEMQLLHYATVGRFDDSPTTHFVNKTRSWLHDGCLFALPYLRLSISHCAKVSPLPSPFPTSSAATVILDLLTSRRAAIRTFRTDWLIKKNISHHIAQNHLQVEATRAFAFRKWRTKRNAIGYCLWSMSGWNCSPFDVVKYNEKTQGLLLEQMTSFFLEGDMASQNIEWDARVVSIVNDSLGLQAQILTVCIQELEAGGRVVTLSEVASTLAFPWSVDCTGSDIRGHM
jgi:hypothetical protein